MSRRATVSRSQAFTRFLPGAIETVDGETLEVYKHEIAGAELDNSTRDYLQEQIRDTINRWLFKDVVLSSYVEDPASTSYEFVTTVRLFGSTLSLVECKRCKVVRDVSHMTDKAVPVRCDRPTCKGRVRVVPFVEIHGCGALKPLRIEPCAAHGTQFIILDRSAVAEWRCGICGNKSRLYSGYCGKNCYFKLLKITDPGIYAKRSRVPVGSSAVFQSQSIDVLNPPQGELGALFRDYRVVAPMLFVANYFGEYSIPFSNLSVLNRILLDYDAPESPDTNSALEEHLASLNVPAAELSRLVELIKAQSQSKALASVKPIRAAIEKITTRFPHAIPSESGYLSTKQLIDLQLAENLVAAENVSTLSARLIEKGGICAERGSELLSAISKFETFGVESVVLVPDFPIVSCAYGFTRGYGARAGKTQVLRAFPKRPSVHGGSVDRTPFYIVPGRTEAIVVRIDPTRIAATLYTNHLEQRTDVLSDRESAKSWIFENFQDPVPNAKAQAIQAIVHSFSHRLLEQVSVESCFSAVSLSEMLMPAAASFIIYVNQRSEFNIGGLAAFVEQRLSQALAATANSSNCMFDPICETRDGGACNGCLYLPEVTCRLFNQSLSRSMLYGGALSGELGQALGVTEFSGLFSPRPATSQ